MGVMQTNTPKQILVIGGSGFLSGTIARLSVSLGHHVTIVTRGNKPIPDSVDTIKVDRSDRDAFAQLLSERNVMWDLVVDSIAFSPEDAQQDIDVFAGKTRRFVLVSTDFVYDPKHRNIPQNETDAHYTTEGYGGKKRQAELILEKMDTASLPWTVLRPGHIYGPGSLPGCLPLHGRDPKLIDLIRNQQPLTLVEGGKMHQHPIFAPDLAATILSAMDDEKAIGQILNVAGPQSFASVDYYHTLGRLLGQSVTIQSIDTQTFLVENPDKAPFCCERVYDLTAIKSTDLSMPATSLEDGLKQMLDAMD
ncbi:MAG: hypothetical protein CMJ19_19300 [Phycisphaeraceae bacterium]|nr:hypothetical protein [Phycisphaeraceae bacterium]